MFLSLSLLTADPSCRLKLYFSIFIGDDVVLQYIAQLMDVAGQG